MAYTPMEKILIYTMGVFTGAVFWRLVRYVYDWGKEAKRKKGENDQQERVI